MKYAPKKVFILDNGIYTELSYEKFCSLKENDVSYADKFFIPLHGMLIKVRKNNSAPQNNREMNLFMHKKHL